MERDQRVNAIESLSQSNAEIETLKREMESIQRESEKKVGLILTVFLYGKCVMRT